MQLTREEALKIIATLTDVNDAGWETATEDHYDEENDDLPTIYDVLAPLGVSKAEYDAASTGDKSIKALALCLHCRSMFDSSELKLEDGCPNCGERMDIWVSPEGVIDAFDREDGHG